MQGEILATCRNKVSEHRDAVAHAEIEAIRTAGSGFENGELRGATLYSTLQPCGMCTMACLDLVQSARNCLRCGPQRRAQNDFEVRAVNTLDFVANAYRDDLIIEGGVRDECARVYYRPWDPVPVAQQGNTERVGSSK